MLYKWMVHLQQLCNKAAGLINATCELTLFTAAFEMVCHFLIIFMKTNLEKCKCQPFFWSYHFLPGGGAVCL